MQSAGEGKEEKEASSVDSVFPIIKPKIRTEVGKKDPFVLRVKLHPAGLIEVCEGDRMKFRDRVHGISSKKCKNTRQIEALSCIYFITNERKFL